MVIPLPVRFVQKSRFMNEKICFVSVFNRNWSCIPAYRQYFMLIIDCYFFSSILLYHIENFILSKIPVFIFEMFASFVNVVSKTYFVYRMMSFKRPYDSLYATRSMKYHFFSNFDGLYRKHVFEIVVNFQYKIKKFFDRSVVFWIIYLKRFFFISHGIIPCVDQTP